jgi:hypothetical protein
LLVGEKVLGRSHDLARLHTLDPGLGDVSGQEGVWSSQHATHDLVIESAKSRTLAVAFEASAAAWVPLDVGRRAQQTVHTPRPALLSKSHANTVGEFHVE